MVSSSTGKLSWTNKKFFFQLLKLSKLCGKKLVKKIGENIWRTRYRIRLFLCIFNRFSLPLVHRSERNMVFRVPISCEGHNFKFLSKLIDDRYQFFSTCNKYFRVKHDLKFLRKIGGNNTWQFRRNRDALK